MITLGIDIETYSSVDLKKAGMYKYAQSPDFEILMIAYKYGNEPVRIIDLSGINEHGADADDMQELNEFCAWLTNPAILKTAHNAAFEITCLSEYFKIDLDPAQWSCTMAYSAQLGLPLSLDQVATVLKLQNQKDKAGKDLIRYFCLPCKPTKVNGGRTRNLPQHSPEKWEAFKNYCVKDVEVEQEIRNRISFYSIPETEKRLWILDQQINSRGVEVDMALVEKAIKTDLTYKSSLIDEAVQLTGLENPNSTTQLKNWLEKEMPLETVESLNKEKLPELINAAIGYENQYSIKRVLEIRQLISKTSIKKYDAIKAGVAADGRVRGLLQYYGANRTGRWAGRLVQVQNLPKNDDTSIAYARQLLLAGKVRGIELLFGDIPAVLSQLIRTSFVAAKGKRFIVSDFSAIEARVIAWLARENWRLDFFNRGGDIYVESFSRMFHKPVTEVTPADRQKGKIAELALGYQGGPGAMVAMGALKKGLQEEELPAIVAGWRKANAKIVRYWYDVQEAAIECVKRGRPTSVRNVKFSMNYGALFITLPSGRNLVYLAAEIRESRYGQVITYRGVDQEKKTWGPVETYGGKLVENIVQATARDLLAHAMLKLDEAGYDIVLHVHDEVVCEMQYGQGSADEVTAVMKNGPDWAKGLPLDAKTFETEFYLKD